jgi:hypothetical protein
MPTKLVSLRFIPNKGSAKPIICNNFAISTQLVNAQSVTFRLAMGHQRAVSLNMRRETLEAVWRLKKYPIVA